MFVIDASVWVSLFIPQDTHHVTTRRWLDRALPRGELLSAPISLLAEVSGGVARRLGGPSVGRQALRALEGVASLRLEPIDGGLGRLAAELAADLRMRGADALYVALAVRLGVPLVSWDREQRERGSRVARTLSPEEALAEAPADGRRDGA